MVKRKKKRGKRSRKVEEEDCRTEGKIGQDHFDKKKKLMQGIAIGQAREEDEEEIKKENMIKEKKEEKIR